MQYESSGARQTKAIAKEIAKKLAHSLSSKNLKRIIALVGNLGAGKTTFVQGFAEGLGIKDKIISPTFVLIRQHKIPGKNQTLFHIDLYRLENSEQFQSLGLEEIINDPNNIVLIEWAEKAKNLLPKNTTWIYFEGDGDSRRISISTDPM